GEAAAEAGATAMIDLSDGLGGDLARVAAESVVGFRISGAAVPVAPGATLDDALAGGDDYELCFTAPDADAVAEAFARRGLAAPTRIGEVVDDGLVVATVEGEHHLPGGWEHPVP
ncbi:MAG TPA: AIR synthase-related protein, partial [Acidimicrobiia bacterium]|nr:AIR synthase-related protein [Acidimicrobiia bacterium]